MVGLVFSKLRDFMQRVVEETVHFSHETKILRNDYKSAIINCFMLTSYPKNVNLPKNV